MNILLTGATGLVGQAVTRHLSEQQTEEHQVYYAVRRPTLVRDQLPAKNWQIRQFDFEDPCSYGPALQGIDRLFLLRPPQLTDVKGKVVPLLETAKQLGVKQVVFLSIQGAAHNKWTPHYKMEQAIKRSGLPYTFLRAGFFMQNLLTAMLKDIRERDEIFVPASNNRFNFVDVDELGEVACKTLLETGHEYQAYTLVGTSPLDYYRVAGMLSSVLQRPIRYSNPSVVWFAIKKLIGGTALPFVIIMIILYRYTKLPPKDQYAHTLQRLLHRPPKQLLSFIEENSEAFFRG
ncbi:MAG: NmrA family NAD(P)-binding protein [Bacteroidetes bacterium]|jgi:uncharacterized protein YbjT (DUF2867 family)|nr:NmrA family NAD(P)-binding protein [Bacteroidota bacterium]